MNRIVLMFTLIIIGCKSGNNKVKFVQNIRVNDTLVSKKIKINKENLLPKKIFVTNNKFVIFSETKKNIFNVFDLDSFEHLYSFGNKGRGPLEFNYIDGNSMKILGNNILFRDSRKVKTFNIGDNDMRFIGKKKVRPEKYPVNDLQMINDSLYCHNKFFEKGAANYELEIININTKKTVLMLGEFPDEVSNFKREKQEVINQIFSKTVVSNNDGNLVIYYENYNKIKMFKNELLSYDINIISDYKNYSLSNKPNNIVFRTRGLATKNHFYALCFEKTEKDLNGDISLIRPKIEIWNWKGELIEKYHLDNLITQFTVSEERGKLYGVSPLEIDKIYEYDLPKKN